MAIEKSESFNYHSNYFPATAYDGNYDTHYSPKDSAMAGNFLKLYFTGVAGIGEVKMVSRRGFTDRMLNTEVRVYCCSSTRVEVKICGKIIGRNMTFDMAISSSQIEPVDIYNVS